MRVNSKNQFVRSDQPCPMDMQQYRDNYDRIFGKPLPKPGRKMKAAEAREYVHRHYGEALRRIGNG